MAPVAAEMRVTVELAPPTSGVASPTVDVVHAQRAADEELPTVGNDRTHTGELLEVDAFHQIRCESNVAFKFGSDSRQDSRGLPPSPPMTR